MSPEEKAQLSYAFHQIIRSAVYGHQGGVAQWTKYMLFHFTANQIEEGLKTILPCDEGIVKAVLARVKS